MVLLLCAVKDIKTNRFNRPFPETDKINAIRGLSIVVNDPNSQIHHFPQDFEVWQIGTFDDFDGKIESKMEFIESALTLKKLSQEIELSTNKNAEKR